MRKRTNLVPWIVTGIFFWPFLAWASDKIFGWPASEVIAYLGIVILCVLGVYAMWLTITLARPPMQFRYNTYRRAESKACEKMHRLFGLYKNDYKYVGAFRDATKFYAQIRERRKREHQKWPMQRYIANTAIVRSLVRSTGKGSTPAKCGAIPTTP